MRRLWVALVFAALASSASAQNCYTYQKPARLQQE